MSTSPLSDLVVLDLSHILSGPFATMTLGDFGARVIKVEPPGGEATRRWGPPFRGRDAAYFFAINRNKESIVLDLKAPADRAVFERLVARADVLVENFRPGTLARLGWPFSRLHAINPRLILCSISGFGQTGPRHLEPGFDQIAQGMSGLMAVTGTAGGEPVRAGFSIGDLAAAMWAVVGILLALRHRDRTGQGQWVDVSLLDSLIAFQTFQAQNFFATGEDPQPNGSAHPNLVPYQAFRCADGYLNVAVGNDALWAAFCHALDLSELADHPHYRTNADRVAHKRELVARIGERLGRETVEQAWDRLRAAGVPAGPIYSISQVFRDPQVQARALLFTLDHPEAGPVEQIASPVRLSATPAHPRTPPPLLDADGPRIRSEVGADGGALPPDRPPAGPGDLNHGVAAVNGEDLPGDPPRRAL